MATRTEVVETAANSIYMSLYQMDLERKAGSTLPDGKTASLMIANDVITALENSGVFTRA